MTEDTMVAPAPAASPAAPSSAPAPAPAAAALPPGSPLLDRPASMALPHAPDNNRGGLRPTILVIRSSAGVTGT